MKSKMMPSWDCFKAKYPTEELQRVRFEDLARCLFCHRHNIRYGISQCVNHAGNETETIMVDGEEIGFQAKYFRKEISRRWHYGVRRYEHLRHQVDFDGLRGQLCGAG